ncbi:cytochrome P450 monooxygenase [Drechmeria coniospora]|uniref:Cytochrome P450 monooxygenase n=1 Tax=Drechmeria coniospora TaxID=98403 RepID=A0A151GU09_DRECN|nr:cytochrome P450 monooxygenase [Drechmeria coniospora]KYK60560.1 cytochrome P450 monooxygenase [Drechmeria coniospora]
MINFLLLQGLVLCTLLLVFFAIDRRSKKGATATPTYTCKDQPFKLLKMDMDLTIIPLKHALELRAVTSDKLDPLTASFDDNAGSLTGILLGSELHSDAIHRRLTPGLPRIIPVVLDELKCTFGKVLPECVGKWAPVIPYDLILNLSTRASARVFVGEPICRDERFLDTSASYSRNTFDTIATFRNLGKGVGALLEFFSPTSSVSNAREQLRYVQQLLGSEVERRRASPDEKHDDFLQWCIDLARTEEEAKPEALAHRTLGILSMAVVHTTAMATTHMLFDIMANPDLRDALKKEQEAILPNGWQEISQKAMLEMRLLDSLMRESQRFNPVGEFTFRRVVRKPITLSDGYKLKPGQQIGLLARQFGMEDGMIGDENADSFSPFRWSHQKQASALFSHSSSANLHFGLGRYACPGRFFASYMIKSIMSRILLEYDLKLEGNDMTRRPVNSIQGDKILPNRESVVLLRRRGT